MISGRKFALCMVLVLSVGFVAIDGYVAPFMLNYETRITKDEIVIGRVDGFGQMTTYMRNFVSGDEKVRIMKFTLFSHRYLSIESSGACHCLTSVYKDDRDDGQYYSLARMSWNGLISGFIGRELSTTIINAGTDDPRVKQKLLDDGEVLEETRHRFAGLITPSPVLE
ncbi:hypothetical protein HZC00_02255 [Candidatus Kaiserbacteria bacterium]|nr:hypothetical protein [Candidatus Kaiserbacteria bacterium]